MNHLLRSQAPISDAGLGAARQRGTGAPEPALAARKLVDFSGPHGWQHSATNLGRTTRSGGCAVRRRIGPRAPGSATGRAARRLRALARGAARRRPWRRRRRLRCARPAAAHQIAMAENVAVFHGWPARSRHRGGARPMSSEPLGDEPDSYPRRVAPPSASSCRAASTAPTDSRSVPSSTGASSRRPSTAATRCSSTCANRRGPDRLGSRLWGARRDQPPRRRLRLRLGAGPVGRLRLPRRRGSPALHRGELQLPGRHARGRCGTRALTRSTRDTRRRQLLEQSRSDLTKW